VSWKLIKLFMSLVPVFLLAVGYFMFSGQQFSEGPITHWWQGNPQMIYQPHIKSYEAQMPMPQEGTVPVTAWNPPLPSEAQAAGLMNPLTANRRPTADDCLRGKTYYEYYCGFCHGEQGDGNGPVGQSYVPKPSDLRSRKVQSLSDGQLLRASLLGTGHETSLATTRKSGILLNTVLPQHRWHIVLYVRSLGQKGTSGPTTRPAQAAQAAGG
jgi:hypothetical protein